MPQIDEADIPELLTFLSARGVAHERLNISASDIRLRQGIVPRKVRSIIRTNLDLLSKPCLVSADKVILDGNHRAAAARVARRQLGAIVFDQAFDPMLVHLYAFPKTYAYGDGGYHPVRN
jgi:hypothetical protein